MIQTAHNGRMMDLHAKNAHGEHTEILNKISVPQLMTHAKHGARQTETVLNVLTAMETHFIMVAQSMVNANTTMEMNHNQLHHSNTM